MHSNDTVDFRLIPLPIGLLRTFRLKHSLHTGPLIFKSRPFLTSLRTGKVKDERSMKKTGTVSYEIEWKQLHKFF